MAERCAQRCIWEKRCTGMTSITKARMYVLHSLFVFTIYNKCHKAYLFLLNIQSVKFVLFPTFSIKIWNVTLAYCSLELIC